MSKRLTRSKSARPFTVVLGFSLRSDPLRTIGALLLYPLARLEGPLVALGLRISVDAAVAGDWGRLAQSVLVIVAALCVLHIVDHTAWQLCLWLDDRVALALDQRVVDLVSRPVGIEHLERPDYLDRLEVLREQGWTVGRAMYSLPMGIAGIARAVATFYLLATVHPLLLLLIPVAIPSLLIDLRLENKRRQIQEKTADDTRRVRHLVDLGTSQLAGKEVRLFGLQGEILARHSERWSAIRETLVSAERRLTLRSMLGWVWFAGGFLAAVTYVAVRVAQGDADPGDLVLTFTLAAQVNREVRGTVGVVSWGRWISAIAQHLSWLEGYAEQTHSTTGNHTTLPHRVTSGIEIRGLTFLYPGTERPVLTDIDLTLPAGSTVAIVGENGAGKSTLAKLLLRLYEPDSGSIRLDGIDIDSFDLAEWRARCTASFQDFCKLEFPARESIGVGDLGIPFEDGRLAHAIEAAQATEVVRRLPHGLDTQLGGSWPDGMELSVGQWQRVALARAMMRESPHLLILDEPTAALDPQTEHTLFQQQIEASRSRANGGVTLIVSHRFLTVASADLIYVLDHGRVIEHGSHAELQRHAGMYADLYRIQAKAMFGDQPSQTERHDTIP